MIHAFGDRHSRLQEIKLCLEVSVINPTGILGPLLGSDVASSLQIIQQLMNGTLKATPQMNFGIVDVRDVAEAHLRAMEIPGAKGQRFILQAGKTLSMHEVAMILKEKMGERANKVPMKVMPNWLVRVAGLFQLQEQSSLSWVK